MKLLLRAIKRLVQFVLILTIGIVGWMYIDEPTLATRVIKLAVFGDSGPTQTVAASGYSEPLITNTASAAIDQEAIDQALEYGATTNSHALLIYHQGHLVLEHYYPEYDAQTYTATASMHKSVLAMLIGIAIEQGHIQSVSEPAANYISEWAYDERKEITIEQLLTQTSGIDFPTFSFNPTGGVFKFFLGDDITSVTLSEPEWATPGSQFDYNNVGPQTLGILLERATGQKYADYLEQNLWLKIGVDPATVQVDKKGGMARTFCCLNATARSWLKIGLLHLNKGQLNGEQIVPEEWMYATVVPGEHEANYGYLTWLGTEYKKQQRYNRKGSTSVYHSEPYLMDDLIYFDGFGGQRVYVIPSEDLVIVRTGDVSMDWDDALLPNSIFRGISQ